MLPVKGGNMTSNGGRHALLGIASCCLHRDRRLGDRRGASLLPPSLAKARPPLAWCGDTRNPIGERCTYAELRPPPEPLLAINTGPHRSGFGGRVGRCDP